jgi:catalase
MVAMLAQVDGTLADRVAKGLGLEVNQKLPTPLNMSVPADGEVKEFQPKPIKKKVGDSPALSMANTAKDSIKTRKVAILGADGLMMPRLRL